MGDFNDLMVQSKIKINNGISYKSLLEMPEIFFYFPQRFTMNLKMF